jgi:uncharacterized protein YodC (DUF2158 family)
MERRMVMALAGAAIVGSLLVTDAQARGGGGYGGGGVGHLGSFGVRGGGVSGVHVRGIIGGGYVAGISRGAAGYAAGAGYRIGIRYGTGILRSRYSVLAAAAFAQGATTPSVPAPAPDAVQNPQIASPETPSGPGLTIVSRDGSSPKTVGMAAASPASAPSNTQSRQGAPAFRSGNLVRLRSGGPLMTVKGIKGDQVDCFWTDFNGQINADSFPVNVLQIQ